MSSSVFGECIGDFALTDAGPIPPRLPIIAEGKHSYDLEYQLFTEAP